MTGHPYFDDLYPRERVEHLLAILEADLIATSNPDAYPFGGRGEQTGLAQPEYGPGIVALTCSACGATWSGYVGEGCYWCQQRWNDMLEHQAEILLTPPDIDPANATYDTRIRGWVERMKRGVQTEIITRRQAEQAVARHKARAA